MSSELGTVEQVQTALGDTDGTVFTGQVIDQSLESARAIACCLGKYAREDEVRVAIIDIAAYRVFIASPEASQKEVASLSAGLTVEDYLDELRCKADRAKVMIDIDEDYSEAYG